MPDHLHERDHRRGQGSRPRAALPARPSAAGHRVARRPARRPHLVHGGQRLVQVRTQRVHRPMDQRRRSAPARRSLRSPAAARGARLRAGQRALHGAHRVPGDRQARPAGAGAEPARARRRRRGTQPGGPAGVSRGDRPGDPRRLRADRDRPADRRAGRRRGPAGLDGPPAAGHRARCATTASWC